MKNSAGSAAAEGTESLYGRNKVVCHPEYLPARCQGRAPCALRTGATQCRSGFSGNCYMAVRNRMPINAAMIVTEESSLTTISLSVATSNSAGIAHGERCRATLHCR